jgi:tyrosine-protein kinase Etk/Wzc
MKEPKDILAVNLKSATRDLLKFWYILAASALLMLVVAYFYLKFSPQKFLITSSIVLRSEQNKNYAGPNNDIMRSFDFMVQDKTFNNEIFYLQSLPLLRDVLSKMDVRVSYFQKDSRIPKRINFGMENIYKDSPIIVVPDDGNSQPVGINFFVEILNENRFYISAEGEDVDLVDLRSDRVVGRVHHYELAGIYDFGQIISNENSSFRVLLNTNYHANRFDNKDIYFRFNDLNRLVWVFKSGFEVIAQGTESTLAHMELTIDNRHLGVDFMTKLIDTYIERNMDEANILANKTIEHIENQLADISDDLNLSERQLQNLRLNRNVMDIEDKSRNLYQQVQNFELRRDEAQRRLNHFRQMNDYFVQYKDSTRILAPSALGLNDIVLNNLINDLMALNAEKSRIINQDQTRNPRLSTINISIENLKDVITENIQFSINTTRGEIEDLTRRINALNREFQNLPGTQRELLDIERRFNLNDAIYTNLLERRIQAQIIRASKLPDAKIIEPPRSGFAGPGNSVIYIVSMLFGLALPSLIIIGRKLIVNHLSSKEDVKMITDFSIIGSIPMGGPREKLILNEPQSVIAESFYMLRSNLVYYLHGDNSKVILVTSSIPGEGKSFTAFNLATSFALSNSKTVLVEFDLRKPSDMLSNLNTENVVPGVSSYLINRARLDEIIIKTDAPNLDIISSGQIPPNPIALLASKKTQELIRELRKQYDYVIIDTPPHGLLTDSFLLMDYADINLFVVRLNFTKKSVLAASIEDFESKNIDNLYLLVNGGKNEMHSYGYGKYPYFKKESRLKFLNRNRKSA